MTFVCFSTHAVESGAAGGVKGGQRRWILGGGTGGGSFVEHGAFK